MRMGESSKRRGLVWSWLMGVPGGGKLNTALAFNMLAGSVGVQGVLRCEGGWGMLIASDKLNL